MKSPSLTGRLIVTLTAGTVLLWLISVGFAVTTLSGRLNTAFDGGLKETAERLLPLALDSVGEMTDGDDDVDHQIPLYDDSGGEYLIYQLRLATGEVVLRSRDAPAEAFPAPLKEGFDDVPPWRIYTLGADNDRMFLQMAEPAAHRTESLSGLIVALVLPIAIFVPLAAIGIAVAVRRGLAPVSRFARAIGARKASNLAPIGDTGLPGELQPIAQAVDGLIERLRAALDAERSFAANSAHELRTPLAGSLAQTQRLIAELTDPESRARAIQIETSLHKLTALAEKLLQLSRADAGIARSGESLDLTPAVELVVEDIRRGLPDPARLTLSIPGRPVAALDIDAFGIALRNLIDNALRHGDPGQPVEVVAEADRVAVRNGCATIPPERLKVLVQRFVRGNTTATGSGLGLAIADTIIQQSGGRLELASPAPGRPDGFMASLMLPAA